MDEMFSLLGPCIGHTTTTSAKIWIYSEAHKKLYIKIYQQGAEVCLDQFDLQGEIPASTVEIKNLKSNTRYHYKIFIDSDCLEKLNIDSLNETDLYFWTMPEEPDSGYRYDFLLMSCHNPELAGRQGYKGKEWRVWQSLPEIMNETVNSSGTLPDRRILFALLVGDQIYADDIENDVLQESNENKRLKSYLGIYKRFWENESYRKVLCSLPAYLMWDDHDITDGWGSREDAYIDGTNQFRPDWKNLFDAAEKTFSKMQAERNPRSLSPNGFDYAFKFGRAGFVMADLRSNRNVRKGEMWLDSQFQTIKKWVEENRSELDILFFVSTVVFSHGAPRIEDGVLKFWPRFVQDFFDRVWEIQNKFSKMRHKITDYLSGLVLIVFFVSVPPALSILFPGMIFILFYIKPIPLLSHLFANIIPPAFVNGYYYSIGDLRDDIRDSWYSDANKQRADEVLAYLFDLQNDKDPERQLYVSILSGDIHSAGYSSLYSIDPEHKRRPVISHVVASPVSNPPFNWIGEAFYRKYTPTAVNIGTSGRFSAQIAHHFTQRNIVVCSLRDYGEKNLHFKVKFYIEGFPEPQISIFDIEKCSHKENIKWK